MGNYYCLWDTNGALLLFGGTQVDIVTLRGTTRSNIILWFLKGAQFLLVATEKITVTVYGHYYCVEYKRWHFYLLEYKGRSSFTV